MAGALKVDTIQNGSGGTFDWAASGATTFPAGTALLPGITTTGDTNTGIFFPAADTIAFSEGGAEAMRIDSSGNLLFNSGYGSVATAYGCRAWVNFNGTGTVAIRASGNVSSITDNTTGDYTVNFTTAMSDANYSVVGMGKAATAADGTSVWIKDATTPTTGAVNIITGETGRSGSTTSCALDNSFNSIAVFR